MDAGKKSSEVSGQREDDDALGATYYNATWAVIIGIDAYPGDQGGFDPILYPVNDARDFRDMLRDQFGYRDDHIRFLANDAATVAAIRQLLTSWPPPGELKKNDALIVFFAGHGLADLETKKGFVAGIDSRRSDLATCLPVSSLVDSLAALPCQHRLLILDSCYSGTLFEKRPKGNIPRKVFPGPAPGGNSPVPSGSTKVRGPAPDHDEPATDEMAYYLHEPFFGGMSAGRLQPVYDGKGDQRHSVFTAALLRVLRERADSGRSDHAFTFRQLAGRVEALVRDARIGQIPDWGPLGPGDGDFVFRPTLLGKTPAEESAERDLLARRTGYSSDVKLAWELLQKGDFGAAGRLMRMYGAEDGKEDVRTFEWGYLSRLAASQVFRVTSSSPASCVDVAPDSRRVAVSTCSKTRRWTVLVFDPQKGLSPEADDVLEAANGTIWAIAFANDGRAIARGAERGILEVWDLEKKRSRLMLTGHKDNVVSLAYSSDGAMLASASIDGTVRIWNAATGAPIEVLQGRAGGVSSVAFAPNGPLLAYTSDERTVRLWDTSSAREAGVLRGPSGTIEHLDFSFDGLTLATGGRTGRESRGEVVFWDVTQARHLRTLETPQPVLRIAYSRKRSVLAEAMADGTIEMWEGPVGTQEDVDRGFFAKSTVVHGGQKTTGLRFSPDGRRLVGSDWAGAVRVWDVDSAWQKGDIVDSGFVDQCAMSADGKIIATAPNTGRLGLWDLSLRRRLNTIKVGYRAECVALSDDGAIVASAGYKSAGVWHTANGENVCSIEVDNEVFCLCLLDGARKIALGTKSGEVTIWDVASGTKRLGWKGHSAPVLSLALSPQGASLASGDANGVVKLWDLLSGKEQRMFHGHTSDVTSLAFSPDGRTLVSGSLDSSVVLWNGMSGEQQRVLTMSGFGVRTVAFSPDGRTLAVGTGVSRLVAAKYGDLKLFDPFTGQERMRFSPEIISAKCAGFSRDGRMLVWCSGGQVHFVETGGDQLRD